MMDDKTLFEKLCQQAQEAGLPEEIAKHEVFFSLLRKDIGFFHHIFLDDDGRLDAGEDELMHNLFNLCYGVSDREIDQRFAPFAFGFG